MMNINQDLKLVVPIRSDIDGKPLVRGYHTPISKDVFEQNYRILSAARAAISSKGTAYQVGSGPRIATLTLKDEARRDDFEYGQVDKNGEPDGLAVKALLAELRRLTLILAPTPAGYDLLPVETAIQQGILDEDEWEEAESSLVFFTCFCATVKKSQKPSAIKTTAILLEAETTSLPLTEYIAFLKTSTAGETTKGKAAQSSIPS